MGMFLIVLFVIFSLVILSIPSGLTYLLYRYLKKKGQAQRKIGLVIFALTTAFMIIYSIKFFKDGAGFGPKYETVKIKQNIGGKLICESVYNADIHSWQFDIDYKYINNNGDTLDFENGSYYGREWEKDEQIKKYNNWLILKTGAWYGSDKLIIKNILSDTTKVFDIDNQFIENDSLWKAKNIKSLLNYCCAETFIENINGNEISLKYKFRTDENLTNKYGERRITYKIDTETGSIKMTDIK
jgi:hypothetical protein